MTPTDLKQLDNVNSSQSTPTATSLTALYEQYRSESILSCRNELRLRYIAELMASSPTAVRSHFAAMKEQNHSWPFSLAEVYLLPEVIRDAAIDLGLITDLAFLLREALAKGSAAAVKSALDQWIASEQPLTGTHSVSSHYQAITCTVDSPALLAATRVYADYASVLQEFLGTSRLGFERYERELLRVLLTGENTKALAQAYVSEEAIYAYVINQHIEVGDNRRSSIDENLLPIMAAFPNVAQRCHAYLMAKLERVAALLDPAVATVPETVIDEVMKVIHPTDHANYWVSGFRAQRTEMPRKEYYGLHDGDVSPGRVFEACSSVLDTTLAQLKKISPPDLLQRYFEDSYARLAPVFRALAINRANDTPEQQRYSRNEFVSSYFNTVLQQVSDQRAKALAEWLVLQKTVAATPYSLFTECGESAIEYLVEKDVALTNEVVKAAIVEHYSLGSGIFRLVSAEVAGLIPANQRPILYTDTTLYNCVSSSNRQELSNLNYRRNGKTERYSEALGSITDIVLSKFKDDLAYKPTPIELKILLYMLRDNKTDLESRIRDQLGLKMPRTLSYVVDGQTNSLPVPNETRPLTVLLGGQTWYEYSHHKDGLVSLLSLSEEQAAQQSWVRLLKEWHPDYVRAIEPPTPIESLTLGE